MIEHTAEHFVRCDLWGEAFSPAQAEAETGLEFAQKNEPGDIGHVGRYKGKSIPYGSATLESSDEPWVQKWNWLLRTVAEHIETFRSCGAKSIVLHYAYFYDEQCNMEFEPEQLRQIAELEIPFTISCYRNDDRNARRTTGA